MSILICHYCNVSTSLVTGEEIYPHRIDLHNKHFYKCRQCGSYVGCHPRTTRPLGTVANTRLRQLRSQVHRHFDPLWKNGGLSRGAAYSWLAHKLGIEIRECHTALFDEARCREALCYLTNKPALKDQCTAKEYLAQSKGE